jgi:hypothetical protein
MKTKNTMTKLAAGAALLLAAIAPSYGQNNLGAACGCPPVNSRPTVSLTSLATSIPGPNAFRLNSSLVLNCNTTYILDAKIYVKSGDILTIDPGTVIKGVLTVNSASATALVIERGGKINADGTKDCPIVFTALADNLTGAYSVSNTSQWGGVVLLGKASNNLTLLNNGPVGTGKLAMADGLGVVEGFNGTDVQNRFGVNTSTTTVPGDLSSQTFDDNDNSGIMRYVQIKHAGAILASAFEINGLTLASVGRGTILDYIEVVSCGDDNVEFFGGTVNVKHISTLFGNDDMFDWDLGYTGKGQFLFGLKSTAVASASFAVDSDNGIEGDGDDNTANSSPKTHPVFYNMTCIGNTKNAQSSDNRGLAGILAKDYTEGEVYNSIFANFKNGFTMSASTNTLVRPNGDTYNNWSTANPSLTPQTLKVKCNTFVNCTQLISTNQGNATGAATAAVSPADLTQFTTTDFNTSVPSLGGFNFTYTVNLANNGFNPKADVVPNPAIVSGGCPTPNDGFFVSADYRGAFSSSGKPWISDWSYSVIIGAAAGLTACPTDLSGDGVTNINDFLLFTPSFGATCPQ